MAGGIVTEIIEFVKSKVEVIGKEEKSVDGEIN